MYYSRFSPGISKHDSTAVHPSNKECFTKPSGYAVCSGIKADVVD